MGACAVTGLYEYHAGAAGIATQRAPLLDNDIWQHGRKLRARRYQVFRHFLIKVYAAIVPLYYISCRAGFPFQ